MSLKDDLRARLIKSSTVKETNTVGKSKVMIGEDSIPTSVPMINAALSGNVNEGLTAGLTVLAGPSKHFKTGFSLLMVQAFLEQNPGGIVLFYDSEFGTPQSYFDSFGIDLESIVHTPVTNIEELKFDVMTQLDAMERKDAVMIVIDSVGNIASKKEVEDALDGKSVADMTRAKQLKSLFRMVTPHLKLKSIPMIAINHTYQTQEMFSKAVVSGGTGIYYSADTIWILGRQQDKDGKDIKGYHFIINVDKSRFVKEKSKIPISISWDGGINKMSGLLEQAMEHGSVVKTKPGWYAATDTVGSAVEPSLREKQIVGNKEFWDERFKNTELAEFIQQKYQIGRGVKVLGEEKEPEDA